MVNYEYDKKRFESFIDAVFAIILTILVLELRIPDGDHNEGINTRQQVIRLLPSFLSYIGSFLLIVDLWIDHSLLFLNVKKLTKRYIVLNMLFILTLSIVPFSTAFAGHNYKDVFAVTLLFINYVVMNISFGLLYWYGGMKKLLPEEFASENKSTAIYSMIGIVLLIIAIPLAYVNTFISFAIAMIVFTGHMLKKK
jgi:uncharacterized membrane protein